MKEPLFLFDEDLGVKLNGLFEFLFKKMRLKILLITLRYPNYIKAYIPFSRAFKLRKGGMEGVVLKLAVV